jgi:quercetin dioxygenase-like cupin family protein
MPGRTDNLQRFIDAAEAGIQAKAVQFPAAMPMAERIFSALKENGEGNVQNTPARLAVCSQLDHALGLAQSGPDPIPGLADAFAAIEPEFAWSRRPEAAKVAGDFYDNHANATIIGDGGLEARRDVRIGVSLVAPGIEYPRHRHPPEELYIVLAPGKWMRDDNPLALKQSGALVHNPPNAWHAMQSMETPLLAIWCLWTGD